MFILLTKFLYPIDKKIHLSKHFGFYFDNPRTKEEIEAVRSVIKRGWDLSEINNGFGYQRFPMKKEAPDQDVVTCERIIEDFCRTHFSKKETEQILSEVEGNPDKIIDFYAKYWVIVHYDNKEMQTELSGLKKQHQENKKKGVRALVMVDDDHIFEKRNNQIINYSYLLSLLSGKEEYFGWNFLMTESRDEVREQLPNTPVMLCIMHQMIGVKSRSNDSSAREFNFVRFLESAKPYIELIDQGLKSKKLNEESLLYIGDTLASAKPHGNRFSSLVRLVGIIEMLVTHQPDFSRFNVDESITKQFVLKTSVLSYMGDKKLSLEEIKKDLKEIYSQRSNIVHGNFMEVEKFLKKLKKEDRYFDDLISNAYKFARICLVKHIEDPEFVHFLKES
ncbi:MAG TPA: hypothetical protein VGE62_04095 [Candidatus Paceibacterota bacterium]